MNIESMGDADFAPTRADRWAAARASPPTYATAMQVFLGAVVTIVSIFIAAIVVLLIIYVFKQALSPPK